MIPNGGNFGGNRGARGGRGRGGFGGPTGPGGFRGSNGRGGFGGSNGRGGFGGPNGRGGFDGPNGRAGFGAPTGRAGFRGQAWGRGANVRGAGRGGVVQGGAGRGGVVRGGGAIAPLAPVPTPKTCITCQAAGHEWMECRGKCVFCDETATHPGRACPKMSGTNVYPTQEGLTDDEWLEIMERTWETEEQLAYESELILTRLAIALRDHIPATEENNFEPFEVEDAMGLDEEAEAMDVEETIEGVGAEEEAGEVVKEDAAPLLTESSERDEDRDESDDVRRPVKRRRQGSAWD